MWSCLHCTDTDTDTDCYWTHCCLCQCRYRWQRRAVWMHHYCYSAFTLSDCACESVDSNSQVSNVVVVLLVAHRATLYTVEEEHGILTENGRMFSLPHFHFQFKSVNIPSILTSKLKTCVYIRRLLSWLLLGIYISWVESSINKHIHLNWVLFLHRVISHFLPKIFRIYGHAICKT